jgi:hypothetical protein
MRNSRYPNVPAAVWIAHGTNPAKFTANAVAPEEYAAMWRRSDRIASICAA